MLYDVSDRGLERHRHKGDYCNEPLVYYMELDSSFRTTGFSHFGTVFQNVSNNVISILTRSVNGSDLSIFFKD